MNYETLKATLNRFADPSLTRNLTIAFCIALVILTWALTLLQLQYEQRSAIDRTMAETGSLAKALEEHVIRTIGTADLVLREIDAGYRKLGRKLDIQAYARERHASLAPFSIVSVTDENGDLITRSLPIKSPLNFRNVDNFQFHSERDSDELYIGTSRRGVTSGKWTLYLSRRIDKADGSFGGVAFAGIDTGYLSGFYEQVGLGTDSVVVLVGRDGIVRARYSGQASTSGQDVSASGVFTSRLPSSDHGSFVSNSVVDGVPRIFSYRALQNYPLVVLVGVSEAAALAPFRARKSNYVGWASGMSVVILVFGILLAAQISRLARTNQALRESEARLNEAQSIAKLGSWELNLVTGRLIWSDETYKIFEIDRSQFGATYETFLAAVHPEDREAVNKAYTDSLVDKSPYVIEHRLVMNDGRIKLVRQQCQTEFDGSGKALRSMGTVQDITGRKRSEQLSAQLAAIVESSNDAIISRGLDRGILTWNAAAERLFGYSAAEAIGRNVSLLIPADQEARAAQGRALLEDGLPVSAYDAVRLGKDGRRIDVSIIASPIKDASGKMSGASLVFRDIGERKRAEVEHAQLGAIVESSNDAILIRGPDRTILTWNAAAERLFGWSAQEAVGQSIDLIVPRERIGILQPVIERAARGEPVSPIETTNLRRDGARIPTQITLSPVRDKHGNIVAHSYTVRDMSELKRKEETLRSYATRLRELSRRLREVEETERHAISRELHDRIGQELSTLTLLLGKLAARLTKESPGAVQKQLQDMQALLKSTVANVRDVMAELRPPVLDDYGLHAALRQLATEFARHSGISVELIGVDLQPRLPSIVETAMFRISQEALNNIAKHAQAKKVEISLGEAAERVVLDIADDGVGFDVGETRQDRQHWGMITMHERAEAVGIALRLESAPGAGTRVVLEVERSAS